MIVHVGPEWEPFTFNEESYDAVISRPVATVRPVPTIPGQAARRERRTRRLARRWDRRIARGLAWFAAIGVLVVLACHASVLGLLDTPADLHPSGTVSHYAEVPYARD